MDHRRFIAAPHKILGLLYRRLSNIMVTETQSEMEGGRKRWEELEKEMSLLRDGEGVIGREKDRRRDD